MSATYIYAWDSVNNKWVKVAVTAAGKIKITGS